MLCACTASDWKRCEEKRKGKEADRREVIYRGSSVVRSRSISECFEYNLVSLMTETFVCQCRVEPLDRSVMLHQQTALEVGSDINKSA